MSHEISNSGPAEFPKKNSKLRSSINKIMKVHEFDMQKSRWSALQMDKQMERRGPQVS
jgi:hypothetical protein